MTRLRQMLAGACMALAGTVAAAQAAPLLPNIKPEQPTPAIEEGLVTQVQAMCRINGRWVPCRNLRRPAPRYYAPPPPRYRYRNQDRCAIVYNQCFPLGRYSPAYMACMRRSGC